MRIHAIEAGRLAGNKTFLRGEGWSAIFRRREDFEFPVFVYIVEHPDGLIAIDTGMNVRGWDTPGPVPRFLPAAKLESPDDEIGPAMRRRGLNPDDVHQVLVTHLDPDHTGGITHFPNAEFFVHRREREFNLSFMGKIRQRPKEYLPDGFEPMLYDMEPEPYGPFETSKRIGDFRLVPLPGHTIGQVGAILEDGDAKLFFSADHAVSQEWFLEDARTARLANTGIAAPKPFADTTRRMLGFIEETPGVVMLPAHDPDAQRRLDATEPVAAAT